MSSQIPPDDPFTERLSERRIRPGAIVAGRFRLEAIIGSGGMAEVYKAVDLLRVGDANDESVRTVPADEVPPSAWVAIKVIIPPVRSDQQLIASLREEVDKARILTHPHIVRLHELYEDAGCYLISMELLDGRPLEKELAEHPAGMQLESLLDILRPVADALEYAHSRSYRGVRGIIHRDISLKNIFISADGVRLIDFGISEVLYTTYVTQNVQLVQFVVGTPPYMSPERFRGYPPDPRDDVYGLAIVIYECLTGRKPFYGDAILQRPENLYPDPPPGLSKKQWNVLKQGLHYHRDKRLASPRALVEGLAAGTERRSPFTARNVVVAAGFGLIAVSLAAVSPQVGEWFSRSENGAGLQPEESAQVLEEEKRRQREADDAAYAEARDTNTREAYRAYLANCAPICGHKTEAEAALEKLLSAKPALPPIQNIHGWSAEKVKALQEQTAAALDRSVVFQDRLKDGTPGPEMVVIPAGEFLMGSPQDEEGRYDNERQHKVRIEKSFAIGRTEVTVEEFRRFVDATGYQTEAEKAGSSYTWRKPGFEQGPGHPVVFVSWNDAMAYAEWLSKETGKGYRLPTEAEWEYAARAGTKEAYWWGNKASHEYANYQETEGRDRWRNTSPAASFPSNPFDLYDILGNVWEWTCSEYDENYNGAELTCRGKNSAELTVLRGGSWDNFPRDVRSAYRYRYSPVDRFYVLGFRLARTITL